MEKFAPKMLQFYCHVEHLLEAENNAWFTGPGGDDLVVWNVEDKSQSPEC